MRPAGAAEDTALSNRFARGGGPRPHPDGQGRLVYPNPAGPQKESMADTPITTSKYGPNRTLLATKFAAMQLAVSGHAIKQCILLA